MLSQTNPAHGKDVAMRRKIATLLGAVTVAGVMSLSMPVASAQTPGYPPGPCIPGNRVENLGSRAIGSTFTIRMVTQCLWDPGFTVNLTVNGQAAGSKTADGASSINVSVTVLSATQLSINDPILVSGGCGNNRVVGTSPSSAAGGAIETFTATFNVDCGRPAATAGAVGGIGGIAFTGANILKWGGFALVLMAGGWLLVGVSRRRRSAPDA